VIKTHQVQEDFDPARFGKVLAKALHVECLKAGCGKVQEMSSFTAAANSISETASASQLFHAVDKNTDGRLSHTELKKYLQKAPWALPMLKGADFHWKDLWSEYDADKDGTIDQSEWVRLYHEKLLPLQGTKSNEEAFKVEVWAESCNAPKQVAAQLYSLAGRQVMGFKVESVIPRSGHGVSHVYF